MNVCADAVPKRTALEAAKAADKPSLMALECVFVRVCVCDGNAGSMSWSSIVGVAQLTMA